MTTPGYSDQFAYDVQARLGIPRAYWSRNAVFMAAWNNAETAHSQTAFSYNPWATTKKVAGSIGGGSQGNIQIYPSYDAGVTASAATISQKNMAPIVKALKAPTLTQRQFAQAVGQSWWNRKSGGVVNTSYVNLVATASTKLTQGSSGPAPPRITAGGALATDQTAAANAAIAQLGNTACTYPVSFPFPGLQDDVKICLDKLYGGLAVAAGGLLMLAGVALLASAAMNTAPARSVVAAATPVTAAASTAVAARQANRQAAAARRAATTPSAPAPADRTDDVAAARARRAEQSANARRAAEIVERRRAGAAAAGGTA